MRFPLLPVLSLAALALGGAAPGFAQCRLCSGPGVAGLSEQASKTPMRIEVETHLDFDRLVLRSSAGGAALLAPDGSRSLSGIEEIGGRALAGTIVVHGEPGRFVRVELPAEIRLFGIGGGQIRISDLSSDAPPAARLDSAGELRLRLGGRLQVSGDADGDYRGEVPITVDYL